MSESNSESGGDGNTYVTKHVCTTVTTRSGVALKLKDRTSASNRKKAAQAAELKKIRAQRATDLEGACEHIKEKLGGAKAEFDASLKEFVERRRSFVGQSVADVLEKLDKIDKERLFYFTMMETMATAGLKLPFKSGKFLQDQAAFINATAEQANVPDMCCFDRVEVEAFFLLLFDRISCSHECKGELTQIERLCADFSAECEQAEQEDQTGKKRTTPTPSAYNFYREVVLPAFLKALDFCPEVKK